MDLNSKSNLSLRELALKYAISQIGIKEDDAHTNKGDSIKYQQAAGLGSSGGYAWCQSFVFWCFNEASKELRLPNPVIRVGGVLEAFRQQKQERKLTKNDILLPGYQFIMKEDSIHGHTGIIEFVDGKILHTIEGNTNDKGERDGYEVCRRIRNIDDPKIIGYLKF